ncbi:hypothetical protein [Paraburkholderia tuberum]|uniref:hypothetical protein n=1 Tax=Paraburkholderia TaxID=1822464 RepID=UPI00039C9D19|nr:hypothetical protein [Paraburkholderia sp. WSM4179]
MDENLDTIQTCREPRRVTRSLTLQYDRVIYLLDNTDSNRKLVGRYIDVYEYPDGLIEIRADGVALPCRPYNRLAEIDQGAVVDHKRLGHVLQVAQLIQADRDNRRAFAVTNQSGAGTEVEGAQDRHKKAARNHR